jgi:hypothetical protein
MLPIDYTKALCPINTKPCTQFLFMTTIARPRPQSHRFIAIRAQPSRHCAQGGHVVTVLPTPAAADHRNSPPTPPKIKTSASRHELRPSTANL